MEPDTTPAQDLVARAGLAGGPFTRVEALRAGVAPYSLSVLVKEGVLGTPLRGVYVPASLADTVDLRAQCLARIAAPHVVVVDRTAAWLWGVSAYSLAEESGVVPLDAFSLRGTTRVRRVGVHGGTRSLLRDDWVELAGVRVTTPVRTAVDLACCLNRLEAVAAIDALMREQGMTAHDLIARLPHYRGRRGVVQARDVLQLVDPRAESQAESFTRVIIVDEGLPVPDLQVWVYDEQGNPVYRLDHAYEELMIAVEYDGEEHHTSPEDRLHDEERRAWLRSQGWIVIVVTKHDMAVHRRSAWIEELCEARRERLEELRSRRSRPRQRADRVSRHQLGFR